MSGGPSRFTMGFLTNGCAGRAANANTRNPPVKETVLTFTQFRRCRQEIEIFT